jgi:hypothetical protein
MLKKEGKAIPITGLCGLQGSQISKHWAHEGDKVVTLTHRPSLPPGISWYSFLEAESAPRGTRKYQLPQNKFQASALGIDHRSFRLVAWCLNHYATPGPKGKAIPLQTWTGPEGSRSLRLPDFKTIGTRR